MDSLQFDTVPKLQMVEVAIWLAPRSMQGGSSDPPGPCWITAFFEPNGFLKIQEHILPLYKFSHYNLTSPF